MWTVGNDLNLVIKGAHFPAEAMVRCIYLYAYGQVNMACVLFDNSPSGPFELRNA